ncbi:4-oxalocrotonate tautomerase family protein [Streptomyces sp. NPDC001852]|uniref:tautomerase family protein n=1 Tax=Streptomyces sp. NPDC001852 TaxID=3364619 RepID=UPI0036858CFD
MPFIEICVPTQLSDDVRTRLIQEVIDRTHEAVGSDPAIINVVVHEMAQASMSRAGKIHHAEPPVPAALNGVDGSGSRQ